jgi:hypothetical protein
VRGELLFDRNDVEIFYGCRFDDGAVRAAIDRFSVSAELVE